MNKKVTFFSSLILFVIIIQLFNSLFRFNEALNVFTLIDDVLMFFIIVSLFFIKKNKTILGKPLLLFFGICCLSAIYNQVTFIVFLTQIRSYLLPFSIYFIIINLPFHIRDIHIFFKKLIWISIFVLMSGYLEFFLGKTLFITEDRYGEILTFTNGISRVYSTIGNPIDFSNFLLVMICLLIPKILILKNKNNSKKNYFLSLSFIIALFLSNSRGPIFAIFGSLFLFLMISKNTFTSKKIKFITLISLIIPSIGSVFLSRLSNLNLVSEGYRIGWLYKSLEIINDNLILGVGPGRFGGWVSINFKESHIYELYDISTYGISSIDMFFPHLFAETGLLGGAAYLLIYLKPFYFFKKFINSMDEQIALMSTTMFLLVPSLLIIGMTSISLETQLILVLYATFLGFAEKIFKINIHEYNTSLSNQSI